MSKKIYLDYAATTPLLPEVSEIMYEILRDDYGNPSSIHHHGRRAKMRVENARKLIAKYLSSSIGDTFFTSGATESCHTIFYGAIESLKVTRIISSAVEHHCTLYTLEQIQKLGLAKVEFLPTDSSGRINHDLLQQKLKESDEKTLVSLMHGNNELGSLHNLDSIGQVCAENKALFMVDAAQTFGKYPINVNSSQIHFLTASAHKFYGPKGTGLMFVSSDHMIAPTFLGGSQERNMRSGTENVHGIVGFAKALELALNEQESRAEDIQKIKTYAISELSKFEDIQFNGSISPTYSMGHVLSVSFPPDEKSDLLMFNLDIAGISASSGSACSSGVEHDSHVLQAIGHDPKRKTIRFSFSHLTTKQEIDHLISTLEKLL